MLDGWWCEGYRPEVGWAIGHGEDYEDHVYQDQVESGALYELLEKDVVPLFYQRGADGMPRVLDRRMKKSMRLLTPTFSTNRMLWEYADRFYLPAARYHAALAADGLERARRLAEWTASVGGRWSEVRIERVEGDQTAAHRVGDGYGVAAEVHLGPIPPADVAVEIWHGPLDAQRAITTGRAVSMRLDGALPDGLFRYSGVIPCDRSGLQGYTVRVRPAHRDANNALVTGLMAWR